ncbi:FAST kinase domain-containing protein 3, mitochondrial-like isoform X2 [Cololabis saira]|nr:FAST kinase domain-containing protein 3, mitochondrial-like isoform X2 [Cololabis saira]
MAQQPCVTDVRCFQTPRTRSRMMAMRAAPVPSPVPVPAGNRDDEVTENHPGPGITHTTPVKTAQHFSPYVRHVDAQSHAAALVNIHSLFEEDVITKLCSKLADFSSNDRAEGLSALLGACVEFGLEAHSPPVLLLVQESLQLLSSRTVGVLQLCRLGKLACALEGRRCPMVAEVINSISTAVEENDVSSCDAAEIYSLMTVLYEPSSQQQTLMLAALHRHTQRLVHQLKAYQVCDILQSLVTLQQRQAIPLVLRLSHRASRVFKDFSDAEIMKVLSALMVLGQHDEALLAAMEKHLPERMGKCESELITIVMEYCLQVRCRSEPIFETVAENFVCSAEKYTTLQIAKQVVTMGRLNYLPQCSGQMFKKLESILSARFSQFQPRRLLDMLHACIHLQRFPVNYINKIFSPYFLQKLQAQGEPMDKNTLRQLTQLHLSTSLECTYYWGPRLPFFQHMKQFSSRDHAFETPMDNLFYKQVKRPLAQLLGGEFYSTRIFSSVGYTVDVEIYLDENGFILPLSQWEQTYKRIALCLDGRNRFCSNTQHLLGKEATKTRHLRRAGYEVVQIPYFEFEKLRTQEEQVQYLQSKIFPAISKFRYSQTTH